MSEYGISLKEFFHDYTPDQIELLQRKIKQRKARDLDNLLLVFQTKSPRDLSKSLQRGYAGYETLPPSAPQQISQAQIETLGIKVIGKDDANR